jgi:ABC-2 type transport system ATP-binding protein
LEYAIETRALEKTYKGDVHALKGVDLKVPTGCCFGLLGPNGAGKSTLVKVLLSIVRASGGTGKLMGVDIRSPRSRRSVGYLPEGHRFPSYLTAEGVCTYFGRLSGLKGPKLKKEVAEKLEMVGLADWTDTKVTKFSKGMAQRVGVAQALLGDPKLVLLDEPTDGVDPMAREGLREVLKTATDRGTTVFINSHLLSEIELLCDQVAILKDGEILQQGSVSEVTQAASGEKIHVRFRTSRIAPELWGKLAELGAAAQPDQYFAIEVKEEDDISGLIDQLRADEIKIYSVEPTKVRLEQAFIQLIRAEGGTTTVAKR